MNNVPIRPSKWFYVLAVLVMITGCVLFVVLLLGGIASMTKGLDQIVVPGEDTIDLAKSGTYTIFYEYQSVYGNKVYATDENLSGLECAVVDKSTGENIPLSPPATASNYAVGGRSGRSIFTFTVTRPGAYRVLGYYTDDRSGPEVVLSIGSDVTMKIVGTVLGAIAIMFVTIILGAAIIIVTFLKRRKASQSLQSGQIAA